MPKLHKWLLSGILLWSLIEATACTPEPPDVPAFESLTQRLVTDPITGHLLLSPSPTCIEKIGEAECCHGVFIMSRKEIFVGEGPFALYNGKGCKELLAESVHLPAKESYAPLATYIINACKKMNCNSQVDRFLIPINMLSGVMK